MWAALKDRAAGADGAAHGHAKRWAFGGGDLARFDGREGELEQTGPYEHRFTADNGDSITVDYLSDMPCGLE